ncbi:MAG: hypothetical protein HQ568_11515 [Calditrichaeota bacterium]|nr:hypothetical protein [Calditrichota bacterium]
MLLFINTHLNEIALGLSIILTAFAQSLLRLGARDKKRIVASFLNIQTISGYLIFFIVVILMIYSMQKIPMRTVVAWNSITYILTPMVGRWLTGDPFTSRMAFGSVIIAVGMVVFSL